MSKRADLTVVGQGNTEGLLRLLRGGLVARGIGVIAGLGLQVAIARTLGAEGAGLFFLCVMTMMIGGILAKSGLDNIVLRQASVAWAKRDMEALGRIYAEALLTTLLLTVLVTVVLVNASEWIAETVFGEPRLIYLLQVFALAILPTVLIWLNGALLKAVERPGAAAMVEVSLLPMLALLFGWGFYVQQALFPFTLGLAYLGGCTLVALTSFAPILRVLPAKYMVLKGRFSLIPRGAGDLTTIELVQFAIAMSTIPMVGFYLSIPEVGVFGVALRITSQITILGVLVGSLISPRLSARHHAGDLFGMEQVAQRGAQYLCVLSVPPLALLMAAPDVIVTIFGSEFEGVQTPLQILAAGQFIRVLSGPAGYCLVMAGYERQLRNLLLLTLAAGLPLTAILIAQHGLIGAAVGSAGVLAVQSIGSMLIVRNKLGIRTYFAPWAGPFRPALSGAH